jgi:hypothetical protein
VDKIEAAEAFLRLMTGEEALFLLTKADLLRLVKLMGLLGSDHQGERDAAALAIERSRCKRGLSWAAIFGVE